MKNFLKRDGIKILMALVFISIGVIILNFTPGAFNISSTVNFLTSPLSEVSESVSESAKNTIKIKKSSTEYEAEIDKLNDEIKKLRAITIDYYDIKKENAQYLKFYDFKTKNKSLKFISSSVIARDPNEIFGGFTLDKGSSAGVSVNDPVITENGLIGRVTSISGTSCKVSTILSPNFKAGVIDTRTRDSGVLVGNTKNSDQNLTRMMYLSAQNSIQPDDIVITSGLGGIYPKDFPVGKVTELKHDDYDSSFYAVIKPFDDIKNIMDVFIITDFLGKGDIVSSLKDGK
ncbi:MAG: Cell shape-determining protein MreC [Eubacteriales bacterium SKADARSKE-1]|nr:Cell shape-determining protein MreC [Eubacteriales bacterium SKADARSKE-1]